MGLIDLATVGAMGYGFKPLRIRRMKQPMRRSVLCLALAVCLAGGSGCSLLRRGAFSAISPVADNMAKSLQKQSDVQLVKDGTPAYLLLMDGLLESAPDNPKLLLAAADANTAYAAAFVDKADGERVRAFYAKARDYGLTVLCQNKKFKKAVKGPIEDFEAAVKTFKKKDVPALYSTATAWVNWIIANSGDVAALAQFPRQVALMRQVLALDPGWQNGGAHMFFGIYYAVQPSGAGRDLEKSKAHFQQAMELAGPDYLLPRVTYAEFYARYTFDRELYESTLKDVLASEADKPEFRLINGVSRIRAQSLLDRVDDYF